MIGAAVTGGIGLVRAGTRVVALGAAAAELALRARLVPDGPEARWARARLLAEGCAWTMRAHGLEIDAAGAAPVGAALLACNHVSWLDPLVVAAIAPCAPVSKIDVQGWPVFGALADRLGVVFHARGETGSGLRVLRQVEATLADGLPVLNFPEGTTTEGRSVLRFHKGLFGLAARLGVPVVPVALRYEPGDLAWTGDATFVPHYLRFASRATSRVRLRFGEPVRVDGGADAATLATATRERVLALLEAA